MKINLGGDDWTLFRNEKPLCPAFVPGCVHEDLLRAGLIADPFVGQNEDSVRWVFEEAWKFQKEFHVPGDLLQRSEVVLCCEGIDTIAQVFINGMLVGATDNMFRRWEFAVQDFLAPGLNHVTVRIESPVDYIKRRQEVHPIVYPTAPHQVPAFSQIRKAAYSFGWDWGPCLPTSGIWKSIYLEKRSDLELQDVHVHQIHADSGEVRLQVGVEVANRALVATVASIQLFQGDCVVSEVAAPLEGSQGLFELNVPEPKLWWPRGMGEQALYEIRVELRTLAGVCQCSWKKRIGLRTLKLNLEPDSRGTSFSFCVNGVPFFVKGSNWIPADSFLTRVTADKYRDLLESAAGVNMNMIRVWGGGVYEADVFYELCDELGLCVWQDFMFACAPYPLDQSDFVENTRIEAEQQLRRLRHHPCIAVWCGNNELEMCGFVSSAGDAGHMSLEEYRGFFDKTLPDILARLSPDASYWPGSPYKEAGENYNPDVWIDSPGKGDAHIWSIWHQKRGFEEYRNYPHRFISEFGFQSFPEPATVGVFSEGACDLDHPVLLHRQRSSGGNEVIRQYMLDWFGTPRDFEATLWCSQILQGFAMQYACEHWRRSMPGTMGTLIWQLNDAWPAVSWSGIDYYGRWKAMHYMARRFYAPLLISGVEDLAMGTVAVHATSDLPEDVVGTLCWQLTDTHGNLIRCDEAEIVVPRCASGLCANLEFQEEIARMGHPDLMLWLELTSEAGLKSSNLVLFSRPKDLSLRDPGLSFVVHELAGNSFRVTVDCVKPALWAWVEIPGISLQCSDNFIHVAPGTASELVVTPERPLTISQITSQLRLRSIFDIRDSSGS